MSKRHELSLDLFRLRRRAVQHRCVDALGRLDGVASHAAAHIRERCAKDLGAQRGGKPAKRRLGEEGEIATLVGDTESNGPPDDHGGRE